MKLSISFSTMHSILLIFMLISNINQAIANPSKEELSKAFQETMATVNKTLPKMISSDTRLDHVTGENNTFHYQYTLVKYSHAEINIEAFKQSMRPELLKNLCTNSTTEFARRYNIPMIYTYFGKAGQKITTLKVAPSECKTTKNKTNGIFNGLLSSGIGGLTSALFMIIVIGIFVGIKKLYFRFFRKFDKIISEGKLAFSNDLIPDANPYSKDEKEKHDAWLKGWEKSRALRSKWEKNR